MRPLLGRGIILFYDSTICNTFRISASNFMSNLDPYHRWLGIPQKQQPPHHYRLLGLDLFESDKEVIRDAAERQSGHVRRYQLGQHADLAQTILDEIAGAKTCLSDDTKRREYNAKLGEITSTPPAPIDSHDTGLGKPTQLAFHRETSSSTENGQSPRAATPVSPSGAVQPPSHSTASSISSDGAPNWKTLAC